MGKKNWPKGSYPQMARKPNAAQRMFSLRGSRPKRPGRLPEPVEVVPEPEPRTLREKLAARRRAERGA